LLETSEDGTPTSANAIVEVSVTGEQTFTITEATLVQEEDCITITPDVALQRNLKAEDIVIGADAECGNL
jgi:hypothetical protein